MKKNEIPPTQAWESLGSPSPRNLFWDWCCVPLVSPWEALGKGKPRPSLAHVGGTYHTTSNISINQCDMKEALPHTQKETLKEHLNSFGDQRVELYTF